MHIRSFRLDYNSLINLPWTLIFRPSLIISFMNQDDKNRFEKKLIKVEISGPGRAEGVGGEAEEGRGEAGRESGEAEEGGGEAGSESGRAAGRGGARGREAAEGGRADGRAFARPPRQGEQPGRPRCQAGPPRPQRRPRLSPGSVPFSCPIHPINNQSILPNPQL